MGLGRTRKVGVFFPEGVLSQPGFYLPIRHAHLHLRGLWVLPRAPGRLAVSNRGQEVLLDLQAVLFPCIWYLCSLDPDSVCETFCVAPEPSRLYLPQEFQLSCVACLLHNQMCPLFSVERSL